jgi:uncharacterized protein (DUF305 family)
VILKENMKQFKNLLAAPLLVVVLGVAGANASAAPFDQAFIDGMTPHHQSALVMAQMAVTKAKYPEVRSLARNIIKDQQKEIAQMKAWRKAWFGSAQMPMDHTQHTMPGGQTMPGMMKGADTMMMSGEMMGLPLKMKMDMDKLKAARGAQFDKVFLMMMIPHHAGAIVMADEAINTSGRPQIRTLAHNIIDSQAKEIGDMRAIYVRHFGKM